MRTFLRKTTLALLFVLTAGRVLGADKVTFEARGPMLVATGESVRIEFELNATPDDGTFMPPSFEGFDVIAGPARAEGTSINIVNGQMTHSVSYKITYVLLAQTAGTYTIGPASIEVKGERYQTQPLSIEVADEAPGDASAQGGSAAGGRTDARGQIGKDDILLRLTLSRTTAYKGEPILAQLKIYSRANLSRLEGGKYPSFNGFWAQELDNSNPVVQRERYQGRIYETQVLRQYLLYPQQSGELTIDPTELTVVAQVVVQSADPDPFFGGMPEVYDVRRELKTAPIRVTIKEFPSGAPASFSGAVGKFSLASNLPSTDLTANSAATYALKISGTGNLPFVQAPKLTLPASFEQYNVKTTESFTPSADGTTGYRQFEYPFIARAEGEYDLPPVEFTYFDPTSKQYVTLSTKALTLNVAPDAGGQTPQQVVTNLSKEDVKLLGQDIRFIKLGRGNLRHRIEPLMLSPLYWGLLAGIVVLFAGAYVALRKRIREHRNLVLMRGKRANKVAVQRFRAAERYMKEQNRQAFYEEVLRALWGYMSDKLNIPVANLTKENVREELAKRGVPAEETQRFSTLIAQCDEAQYSPVATTQMNEIYNEGVDFLSKLESRIKK